MTPEAVVKQWAYKKLKCLYPEAWQYSPPGGPFGRAGVPDRLLCIRGHFVAIEVKAPGGKLTARQLHELKAIQLAGGIAAVLEGRDESKFHRIVRAIEARICV